MPETSFVPWFPRAFRSLTAVHVTLSLIILAACLLSASTWRVYSHTWDEPEHLAAGVELLDRGRYEYDTEHPPIGRALIALGPWLAGAHSYGTPPPDGVQEGIDILYNTGHYQLFLTLARLGTLPFLAVLLWGSWLWARRLTPSSGEALLAVALVAAVPPILGHAALATLDSACAATLLLALYATQRWVSQGSWKNAVLFGITTGIAFGTKFSAIPFVGLGFIGLVLSQWTVSTLARRDGSEPAPSLPGWWPGPSALSRLGSLALVALVAAIPIILAYGVRNSPPSVVAWRYGRAIAYLVHEQGISHQAGMVLGRMWLPRALKDFIEGIVAVKAHNDSGHLSFLLGEHRAYGWWYFYLVALAVKTPIPLLIAGPVGLILKARQGLREHNSWQLAPLVLFLTTLAFASFFSRINIGIRHVLVLYPFLAFGGACTIAALWRWSRGILQSPFPARSRQRSVALAAGAAAVVLAGWQLSTLWTANPDYLPYFNEAVSHPEQILVDSDLDWGQDLRRLEWRLADLKVHSVNLAWIGTADLAKEPLPPYTLLPPRRIVSGWIAITALAREHQMAGYAWLSKYKPIERIGKTIDLYYVPAVSLTPPAPQTGTAPGSPTTGAAAPGRPAAVAPTPLS
jgi:4-amino-4-deoxy-L-arabinose transferase-like glycosyltransferase